jgi:CubicO group peptidase (beta-lactamase class C family)
MQPEKPALISRRQILRTGFAATVGAALPIGAYRPALLGRSCEPYDFEPVRQRLPDAVAHGEATGVSVAITQHGRIIWEEGFGWANRESGLKATPRTPFSLASITKPFTATTLMTLAAEGKLSLDAPANRYLSHSKITGPNGIADGATVRKLGAHAGGLPSMFERYFKDQQTQPPDAKTLLQDYGMLAYPPGACYEYSNIGYEALGAIASNVTGRDFGTLMSERVLEPLGLRDSFYDTDTSRLQAAAVRYDNSGNPIPYYTTSTPPSGELYASALDLARFAMFNMKNHVEGQLQILDPRWIDELHKPVFEGSSGTATTFGWFAAKTKSGIPVISKSGGQPGVATLMYMLPSENLACLVLTNRSDANELAFSVCDQILTLMLPQWTRPDETPAPPRSRFVATPALLGRWEGALANDGAKVRVTLDIQSSDSATLGLAGKPVEKMIDMQTEGTAFTAKTVAMIESPDAVRNDATSLTLKLLPQGGKLVGRVLASSKDGSTVLPYVLTLKRKVV